MGTIRYYNENARAFVESTFHADMRAIRNLFIENVAPAGNVLDLGCGSGRDSKAFFDAGFQVDAVDGSENICREAERLTGRKVICATFEDFETDTHYDGIWACASLLHVERKNLPDLIKKYAAMLKKDGVFYLSFKYGTFEGERRGRYFTDMDAAGIERVLPPCLEQMTVLYTEDVRPGREKELWINVLLKKCQEF